VESVNWEVHAHGTQFVDASDKLCSENGLAAGAYASYGHAEYGGRAGRFPNNEVCELIDYFGSMSSHTPNLANSVNFCGLIDYANGQLMMPSEPS